MEVEQEIEWAVDGNEADLKQVTVLAPFIWCGTSRLYMCDDSDFLSFFKNGIFFPDDSL